MTDEQGETVCHPSIARPEWNNLRRRPGVCRHLVRRHTIHSPSSACAIAPNERFCLVFLLNEGRRPLLEFLRNLTPQALLLSTALLIGVHLDFRIPDLANWKSTTAFFACVAFFLLAAWANASTLLDASVASLERYSRVAKMLSRPGVRRWRPALGTLRIIWRRQRLVFVDLVISLILVNVGVIAAFSAGLIAARTALR